MTTETRMTQPQTRRTRRARSLLIECCFAFFASFALLGTPDAAVAQDRWAVIVSGASGGEKYAEQMATWRNELRTTLLNRYQFKPEFVKVLVDETATSGEKGSAENIRKLFAELKKSVGKDDLVFVIMLGHGTYDGDVAKFNLVGPDMTAKDWTDQLNGLHGRVTIVNTTEASFPFLETLASKGRVVITATDSAAQKYATVFPEYFVKALKEASTDLDKNGRTSIYEVFQSASAAVKQHYEQRGQLTTERALLDDNGDGKGREATAEGPDGGLARLAYLDNEIAAASSNPELAGLIKRRQALEQQAEEHKELRGVMPEAEWQKTFEKLMLDLAQVSAEIRKRS